MRLAKLYNHETGFYDLVSLDEYREAFHKGRLTCAQADCNADIHYVREGSGGGNAVDTPSYFRTSGGEIHKKNCVNTPLLQRDRTENMVGALRAGKSILINLNFPTSYKRDKAHLKGQNAKSAMSGINGSLESEWKRSNAKGYETFSSPDVNSFMSQIRSFRNALTKVETVDNSRLHIRHLHGIMTGRQFFERHPVTQRPDVSHAVFNHLTIQAQMMGKKTGMLWWPFPAFKSVTGLFSSSKGGFIAPNYNNLINAKDMVRVGGADFILNNQLHVTDKKLREEMKDIKEFDIVAAPYVSVERVKKAIDRAQKTIPLVWPVTDRRQVRFHK